ncbi:ABC transporter ATP-binding protein [Nonomuraea rhodomycinica]|uniref:ABC transporter ATP-binding protein n=1 Tax=Nonomuraea rhodomycinica TaxID=1712872 RepID=A0A7Y6MGR7_9ACTN|nr:ABC transporter ATP-binding protein [Nonomuraea rhodomycinica]NUW46174.1 ABC transporter ATP-binding protein [Nonomuraea rhodomycinica]
MERSTPHAVALSGLRKSYGERTAVAGIDLLIAPGEVVALLGPNGAGKSTTVDMMLGLTPPDSGGITLFGADPRRALADGVVGAMLQDVTLLEDATVREILTMIASMHRAPMPVAGALRLAGIGELAERRAARLSGGQTQRVRLAMALVPDPGLLVLDEPTAVMDVTARRAFWHAMGAFAASGRTVLFTTHYLEEAEAHAGRVVLMRDGTIVADGPVGAVMARVGGRTVTALVPGVRPPELLALPGVVGAEPAGDGHRVVLRCSDSDGALRALLARHPGARDVEIRSASLEEAFVLLTGANLAGEEVAAR